MANLFTEVGIEGAKRKTLDQLNFVTRPATSFIDKSCPGNIKMDQKDYAAVNRFFFDNHVITTSEVGDFDPTAGVLGDAAVDENLTGFEKVIRDKARYGLGENEEGYIKGVVLLKMLDEVAPTGGAGVEMKLVPRRG